MDDDDNSDNDRARRTLLQHYVLYLILSALLKFTILSVGQQPLVHISISLLNSRLVYSSICWLFLLGYVIDIWDIASPKMNS